MARTPLLRRLQALSRLAADTQDTDLDLQQAIAAQHSRRSVLKGMGLAGMAAAGASLPGVVQAALGNGNGTTSVAVIGGGLAGLAAAYELKKVASMPWSTRPPPVWADAASATAAPSPGRSPRTAGN